MEKSYYISKMKSNALIEETMTGETIKVDGFTYWELSRAPKGKRILRKLSNLEQTQQIRIYT